MAESKCVWTGATNGKFLTENGNWTGSAPVSGDSVRIPADATVDIDDELDASAVTLVGFTIEEGCSIAIGTRSAGVITPLQIMLKHSTVYYDANLAGTGTMYLEIDDYQDIYIDAAGAAPDTGQWALNLSGTHDDGTAGRGEIHIRVSSGTISIGANQNEDMEVNKILVTGSPDDVTVGASVTEYDDSAAPDLDIAGGTVATKCPLTTVTKTGGTWYHEEGAVTTITTSSGTTYYKSDGTVTTLNASEGGSLDCTEDLRARTITNTVLGSGATINDPHKTITFTNGVDLYRCGLDDVTLNLGNHITVTPSAI